MKTRHLSFRIRLTEVIAVFLFYLFFSLIYHLTLAYLTQREGEGLIDSFLNFDQYWFQSALAYLLFFCSSVVIWLLGIKLLKKQHIMVQILVVFVLCIIAVFLVRPMRYAILDAYDVWHLEGQSAVWDVYIPLLFYFIQFGCYFSYRFFRQMRAKILVEAELRQAALKSEIKAIKAQLNPHFLYNVFNTINASLPKEQEETRTMISQLADLFRYQLKASKKEVVSIAEELTFVEKYLELEKARFEERLTYTISVADEVLAEKIPPMLLQPLVENSIKHGLSPALRGGNLHISIIKENEKLHFKIADTGVGVADKTQLMEKGVGLNNTALRIKHLYQSEMKFSDNTPSGLIIEFSI